MSGPTQDVRCTDRDGALGSLPARVEARQRRDVDRLPRPRRDARALGRGEGPAPRDLRPARPDRALPPRGARGRPGLAPERRRRDRRRRGRRAALHRLRVLSTARRSSSGSTASGGLPLDEAAAYAIEVGRGLGAAHARRLVHRDVKPQNVLIDSEGRAKVTDFGIARELEQDGLTKTGRVLGTTDYVSPEQAMGQRRRRPLRHLLARRSCSTRCSPATSRSRPTTSSAWR